MKAQDVINQLLARLPQETDKFTDTYALSAMVHSAPTLTVDTSVPHLSKVNNLFHVIGARTPITISSFTRVDAVGTIVTAVPHDRTVEAKASLNTVTTSGATEAEFNSTFTILDVVDRNTITVTMTDAGPTTATGSPVGDDLDRYDRSYNRLLAVATAPSAVQFTATTSITGASSPLIGAASVRMRPRISGAIDLDRAADAYTKQGVDKYWAYVLLGDVVASRGLEHSGDAIDRQPLEESWKQQTQAPFSIAVFAPAKTDIAARAVQDSMRDLFGPIARCLLGKKFATQLSNSLCGAVNFVGHGTLQNTGGVYVHGFSFEAVEELGFGDTVGYNDNVAFRDVDMTVTPDLDAAQGDGEMTATAELDL